MTFLIADGVVPSNEDRGYVLRRIMRRAIQQGRSLELDPGFLCVYADRVTEIMGSEYGELHQQRDSIQKWLESEEESFGRTLEQGLKRLDELIERARLTGAEGIAAADAFLLHDTYGFPIDLTLELVAEHDLGVDEAGFEVLMDEQRERARAGGRSVGGDELRERATELAGDAGFATDFVGYETTDAETTIGAAEADNGRVLVKLVESPFYATGGGQVADSGYVECLHGDCRARVDDVLRIGNDQVLAVVPEQGTIEVGERVRAHVDRATRHATECNHTATHLLHAALRQRLGTHVRQAGSYVGPDKLRFDFTHGKALTPEELEDIENQVNDWIVESQPVRALTTTLDEAKRLGAMALFGEKYGDVVRMVEVGDGSFSRELCGGTHVRNSAEVGLFKVLSESSSAANMRRIEAVTGPAGVESDAPPRPHAHGVGEGSPRPARAGHKRGRRTALARPRARAGFAPRRDRGRDRRRAAGRGRGRARRRARAGRDGAGARRQGAARRRGQTQEQARRRGDRAREHRREPCRPGGERLPVAGRARRPGGRDRQDRRGRGRRRWWRPRHARARRRSRSRWAAEGVRGRARGDRDRARRVTLRSG